MKPGHEPFLSKKKSYAPIRSALAAIAPCRTLQRAVWAGPLALTWSGLFFFIFFSVFLFLFSFVVKFFFFFFYDI
jgi:hypothetical protein